MAELFFSSYFDKSRKSLLAKVLYILAYKPTLKKLPENEEFCKKQTYKPTPKIPRCVDWANNKEVSICNALCLIRHDYVSFYLMCS